MERAAQGRAAGVRIGAGSVPVKDRFKQNGRAERQSSRDVKSKKSATSAGALRRSEQKDEGGATKCQRSKLGRLFRRRVGNGLLPVDWLMVLRPRSFLLKEWARRDFTGSPSGNGFSLIISSLYEGNFMIATSPDSGTHLRGLGTLLNRREGERRRREGAPLLEWYDGNSPFFRYRIVANPKGGTLLSPEEVFQTFQEYISSLGPIHT